MEINIERRARLRDELDTLKKRYRSADREDQEGIEERMGNLKSALVRTEKAIISEAASNGRNTEDGTAPAARTRDTSPRDQARDAALRSIEKWAKDTPPSAQDKLEDHLRNHDRLGADAQYVAAVGEESYLTAFGKMLQDPQRGHLRFTPPEQQAVQRVNGILEQRTMSELTSSAGGFAVPYVLDASLLFSSNGQINPVRDLARTETISVKEWRGISTGGTVASFVAELTEASDDSPTLAQPTVQAHRWQAFIPASIELLSDWSGAINELQRVFTEARDTMEATAFLTGDGSDQPSGVLDGLSTSERVQVTSANWAAGSTDVTGAVYELAQALPPRFRPGATYTANPSEFDRIYRSVGGNSTEPPVLPNRGGPLLGSPIAEWSTMAAGTTTGNDVLLVGDFGNYLIADRLGMSVEIVQHVFGTANNRPIGARGLYCYGRTGGSAIVPNGFRYLEIS